MCRPQVAAAMFRGAAAAATLTVAWAALAEVPAVGVDITVLGERPESEAASRVHASYRDLQLRPRRRPGDFVETVPGLFAVQHAGGGKANQWFLRGFDADHGTDIAFFVDGVPVNLVSHGHGQGYSDLHFLIPELVTSLDAYKGPYYAKFGDFSTAGAIDFSLAESFRESRAEVGYGQYGVRRGLVIASPEVGENWHALVAGELAEGDGPFQNPESLRRLNVFARMTHDVAPSSKLSLTWMSYTSTWNGSGQIPARALCGDGESQAAPPENSSPPCIDHFGFVDPSEGGATQRHQASVRYSASSSGGKLDALVYLVRYRFTLFSNFTFFADDPVHGDQIEQGDERSFVGTDARFSRWVAYGPLRIRGTLGVQARADSIDNALWHTTARERLQSRVDAGIVQSELGIFAEADARLTKTLRFIAGLRGDRVDVAVQDRREDLTNGGSRTSGVQGGQLVSPKLMAIVSPLPALDLFGAYGRGFHSNDARGVVLGDGAARLMTPALGYEAGARFTGLNGLSLEASAYLMDLASELVWSGDSGGTEPSGRTRRYGLELGAQYRLRTWLFADMNASFGKARFREQRRTANAVALAPTRTFSAGVGVRPSLGDVTPFAAVRMKALADRPATEDGSLTAPGFTTVDANLGARWKNLELGLDVQNVFDVRYREVNFANESRLRYEAAPVVGLHFSPGWPRTVMGRASIYWE